MLGPGPETSTDVYLGTKSASTEACKFPGGPGALPPVPPPWMSTWEPNRPPQRHAAPAPWMSTWEPKREWENEVRQPELEAPLTKRQLKCRQNKDFKLAKKLKNLEKENDNLKSQMEVS